MKGDIMIRTVWSHLRQRWLSGRREPRGQIAERPAAARPSRHVRLSLEELEPRVVLSTTDMTPPPSFQQAALSLYIDGAQLVLNQDFGGISINGGASTVLFPGAQANIAFNTPYAQPFSQFFVLAGASAALENIASVNSNPANQAAFAAFNNSL
jgi:hypothetical protein